ncbi:MAG: pre-16S rRNA-processing nuclease YqgF [Bacillota bacterium]
MKSEKRVPKVVVAVDPGRDKCGIAVVRDDLTVAEREIAPAQNVAGRVYELARRYGTTTVVLGDRTSSKALAREIEASAPVEAPGRALHRSEDAQAPDVYDAGPRLEIMFVDEHLSSVEGRKRYLLDHPPRGLGRLIPLSLRTPGEPFDDYVAVVLAERFFHRTKKPVSGEGFSGRT